MEATKTDEVGMVGDQKKTIESSSRRRVRALIWLPFLMMGIVLLCCPNYQWESQRATPFGGDFIQDWSGAHIVSSADYARLYDAEYFRSVQHDESLVGFQWSESSYYPPIYPPYYYQLMLPFSMMDYRVAAVVWAIVSSLLVCATFALLYHHYQHVRPGMQYLIAATILFSPFLICLNIGQKSTMLLLLFASTFLLLRGRRPLLAGIVFGLIAFKPHLVILILAAMIWKRQWVFSAGCLATIGSLVGLAWWKSPELCWGYLHAIQATGDYVSTGGYVLADAHSLWGGLQLLMGQAADAVAVKTTVLAVSLVGVVLLALAIRGPIEFDSPRFSVQFSLLLVATILLSPHLYFYDLTVLLLPICLVGSVGKEALGGENASRAIYIVMVLLFFGAGTFAQIAFATRIQPSVVLMSVLVLQLSLACMETRRSRTTPEVQPSKATIDVLRRVVAGN